MLSLSDKAIFFDKANMGISSEVVAPHIDDGKLQYKVLSLENGLQALLVSDEKTQKCAAALDASLPDFDVHVAKRVLLWSYEGPLHIRSE